MKTEEKLKLLGYFKITLIQWKDEFGHWRLGLDWENEDEYYFICEYKTIDECLDSAIKYLKEHDPKLLKTN